MFVDAVRVNLILAESNFSGGRLICRDAYSSRQFRYSAVRREKKSAAFYRHLRTDVFLCLSSGFVETSRLTKRSITC